MRGKKLVRRQTKRARSRKREVVKGKPMTLLKPIRVEQSQGQAASL